MNFANKAALASFLAVLIKGYDDDDFGPGERKLRPKFIKLWTDEAKKKALAENI